MTNDMERIVHSEATFQRGCCQLPTGTLLPFLACLILVSCTEGIHDTPQGSTAGSESIRMIDAMGDTVVLSHPAERVLSLAPNLTEMMFAIGAGGQLIGRTDFCDYPPEAAAVPSVGNYQSLNYERLLAMQPDLILMSYAGNTRTGYEKLKDLGLRPFALGAERVEGVIKTLDTIGILVGKREEGARVATRVRKVVDSVRERASASPLVSVFVVIGREPLMTVSRGFIDESLVIAGGENIAAGGVVAYPTYSREELVRRDPEVIIVPTSDFQDIEELKRNYPEWKQLRAVRDHKIYALPADIILRPGPRIAQSEVLLYQALHGADPHTLFEQASSDHR